MNFLIGVFWTFLLCKIQFLRVTRLIVHENRPRQLPWLCTVRGCTDGEKWQVGKFLRLQLDQKSQRNFVLNLLFTHTIFTQHEHDMTSKLNFLPRRTVHDTPPDHHVTAAPSMNWNFSALKIGGSPKASKKMTPGTEKKAARPKTVGFKNPWPSHQKLSVGQIRAGLEWGKSTSNEYEDVVSQHDTAERAAPPHPHRKHKPTRRGSDSRIVEELIVTKPKWGDGKNEEVTATWLGHAGVLLQMPRTDEGGMIRIVMDPIFSDRWVLTFRVQQTNSFHQQTLRISTTRSCQTDDLFCSDRLPEICTEFSIQNRAMYKWS